jgi:hypothetical protein
MSALAAAYSLISKLDMEHIQYTLRMVRPEALMVCVAVPGGRWEIELFDDDHVELERFISKGIDEDINDVTDVSAALFAYYSGN